MSDAVIEAAYEECLDQANYLKRSIMELDGKGEAMTTTNSKLPVITFAL